MEILVIAIHVIVCFALIMIVLLQTGKGADLGAAFGAGSSQTLFGSSGAGNFLTKATTVAAIVFMLTSLILAYYSGGRGQRSVMKSLPVPTEEKAPAVPGKAGDAQPLLPPSGGKTQGMIPKAPMVPGGKSPAMPVMPAPVPAAPLAAPAPGAKVVIPAAPAAAPSAQAVPAAAPAKAASPAPAPAAAPPAHGAAPAAPAVPSGEK